MDRDGFEFVHLGVFRRFADRGGSADLGSIHFIVITELINIVSD